MKSNRAFAALVSRGARVFLLFSLVSFVGFAQTPGGVTITGQVNNNVNDDTQRVTASNPNLKPQYSDNYDLSVEYYQ